LAVDPVVVEVVGFAVAVLVAIVAVGLVLVTVGLVVAGDAVADVGGFAAVLAVPARFGSLARSGVPAVGASSSWGSGAGIVPAAGTGSVVAGCAGCAAGPGIATGCGGSTIEVSWAGWLAGRVGAVASFPPDMRRLVSPIPAASAMAPSPNHTRFRERRGSNMDSLATLDSVVGIGFDSDAYVGAVAAPSSPITPSEMRACPMGFVVIEKPCSWAMAAKRRPASVAVWRRFIGSLVRSSWMSCSLSGAISGLSDLGFGGSMNRCEAIISPAAMLQNGGLPHSVS
jgi:hypothetical protein